MKLIFISYSYVGGFGNGNVSINNLPPTWRDLQILKKQLEDDGMQDVIILNWQELRE